MGDKHASALETDAVFELVELLDELDDSVAVYQLDATILRVNRTTAQLFGRAREELIGHRLWDLFPEARSTPFYREFTRVAETGAPSNFEHHYEPWQRWYDNRIHRTGDTIYVLARDITARKRAEADRERERQNALDAHQSLAEITNALPALVALVDRDHRYRFINQTYQSWFGMDPSTLVGRHVRDVLGEAAYARVLPHMERALAGEVTHFDTALSYPSGSPRHVRATYVPRRGPSSEVTGYVSLVADITSEKLAHLEAQHANARLRVLADASAVFAEAGLSLAHLISRVSAQVSRQYADSCAVQLIEGDHLIPLAIHHPDAEAAAAARTLLGSTPYKVGEGISGKVAATGKSLLLATIDTDALIAMTSPEHRDLAARYGTRSIMVAPMFGRHGTVLGVLAVGRITSQEPFTADDLVLLEDLGRRAGLAIEAAQLYERAETERARAEQATLLRERLIAVLGHDLRNPLAAIQTSAVSLLRRGELNPKDGALVQRMLGSADRMGRMISQLLDFSLLRQGHSLPLRLRDVDLAEICRTAAEELRLVNPQHTFILELEDPAPISGDGDRLYEVLSNLIGNAVQHGRAEGTVTVSLVRETRDFVIDVHNQGGAIPNDRHEIIFDPYQRAGAREGGRSIGLGLYIAREIIREHGGRLEVRSPERDGTTFRVILPQTHVEVAVGAAEAKTPRPRVADRATTGASISSGKQGPDPEGGLR